ncbi:hypothetical protein [Rathayibacter sp. AY1A3]|uniref:hypothetical protein n=1 Tax=Rathayibacter sp. AY1A3 TaxID=2080521 RepID=UPI0011B0137E|nr:hypothetical protein [Rathayibacter sp. AY1A3]
MKFTDGQTAPSIRVGRSGNGARIIAWIVNPLLSGLLLILLWPHLTWSFIDIVFLMFPVITVILAIKAPRFGIYVADDSVLIKSWFRSYKIGIPGILFFSETPYAGFLSRGVNFLPGDISPLRMMFCSFYSDNKARLVQYPVTIGTRGSLDETGRALFEATRVDYVSSRVHFSDKPD